MMRRAAGSVGVGNGRWMACGLLGLTGVAWAGAPGWRAAEIGPVGEAAAAWTIGPPRSHLPERYDGHQVVRIDVRTLAELRHVSTIGESILNCTPGLGAMDVQVTPSQRAALARLGFEMEMVVADLQALVDRERAEIEALRGLRETGWFEIWRPLDEHEAFWAQLAVDMPDIVGLDTIGHSLENRAIRRLTITGSDGPIPIENRPAIIFNGCQHAREWISPTTVAYIADRLARDYGSDPRVTALLDEVVFHIVPIVNPDGYEYTWTTSRYWRKNRRNNGNSTWGVDLNRNWAFEWGGLGSSNWGSSDIYHGAAPFSEPETRALRDLALTTPNLVGHIDYHSYGQLILYPFGYQVTVPPQPDLGFFQHVGHQVAAAIDSVYRMIYAPMAAHRLYVHSGIAVDWFYAELNAISLCIELRPPNLGSLQGFSPPAHQILPTAIENFEGAMAFAEIVALPLSFTYPEGRPTLGDAGNVAGWNVLIRDARESFDPDAPPRLWFRAQGADSYASSPLTLLSNGLYTAELIMGACGEAIEYYIEATTASGAIATSATPHHPFTILAAHPLHGVACFDRADLTGPDGRGVPDGRVCVFDLEFFIAGWLKGEAWSDLTGPGFDGVPDGTVDVHDLNFFIDLWLLAVS